MSNVATYQAEIKRFSHEWDRLKRALKAAKTDEARKSINHQLVTVKMGRGQLRRVIEYLQSHERLRTRGAQENDHDESRD